MKNALFRDLLILTFFLSIFYLLTLGLRPVGVPDEGRYVSIAYQMYLSGDYITPLLNGVLFMDKPVLYYWLEALSMHAFGVNHWAMRFPMAALGMTSILAVFVTGNYFFNRTTAWLATLILATSPLWYVFSQYANMDLEVASWINLTLICILFGLHIPRGPGRRLLFYLAYTFAAAATLTKGLMGIVFPVLILAVYALITRELKLIKSIYFPSGITIYLVVTLPWFLLMQKAHPDFLHYFFYVQHWDRFTDNNFNNLQPCWFFIEIILIGLLPWSLMAVTGLRHAFWKQPGRSRVQQRAMLFLGLWVVLLFLFFSYPSSKPIGYILPVIAPLSLLFSACLSEWIHGNDNELWPKYSMGLLSLIISILLLVAGFLDLKIIRAHELTRFWVSGMGFIGIIFSLWAIFTTSRLKTVILLGTLPMVLCIGLPVIAGMADTRSVQPLLNSLRHYLDQKPVVIGYDKYFYDLPLKLQQKEPVIVVSNWDNKEKILSSDNWRRELYLGMQYASGAKKWLMTYEDFGDYLVTSDRPLLVFAREYAKNKLQNDYKLHFIAQYGRTIVMSNYLVDPDKYTVD